MIESNSIQPPLWSEQNSQQFIDFADYFVPDRKIQMEIIRDLIPVFNHPIHVLEICCGEGLLAQTILDKREDISMVGIDGSSAMLWKARHRLSSCGPRFQTFEAFQNLHWNLFRFPDEMDMPSPLTDHFHWLAKSGFQEIDTSWLKAGHAIYSGVKPRVPKTP